LFAASGTPNGMRTRVATLRGRRQILTEARRLRGVMVKAARPHCDPLNEPGSPE
jgi:hypothetical protein